MKATPHWNSAARELWWAGRCVKQFHNDAALQRALLDALEAAGWPRRMENPLPGGTGVNRKKRLRNTVKNLNRGLVEGSIRFRMDGTAEAVRWEIVEKGRRGRNPNVTPTRMLTGADNEA